VSYGADWRYGDGDDEGARFPALYLYASIYYRMDISLKPSYEGVSKALNFEKVLI
jgi:hypothetical protein